MQSINVTQARADLYKLIAEVNENATPVTITNARGKNAVMIGEADWRAIQETIYLNAIPGLAESLIEASRKPISEGVSDSELDW